MPNKMVACRYHIEDIKAGLSALKGKDRLLSGVFSLMR